MSTMVEDVLRQRAEKMAKRQKEKQISQIMISLTILGAGTERFGIPTESLSCIVKTPKLAAMPNLPPWIKGMAQIRGELVGVVDLASWFGVPSKFRGAFMAMVEGEQGKLGLLVDSVVGFREVGSDDIAESFGDVAAAAGHPIVATTKDLTAILDIKKLFASPDVRVAPGIAAMPTAAETM